MLFRSNTLAQSEVNVARYYLKRGAHVAAINRAQAVLQDYKDVPAAEDALKILIECYDALGLTQQRDDTRRVLNASFPPTAPEPVKKPWWKKW